MPFSSETVKNSIWDFLPLPLAGEGPRGPQEKSLLFSWGGGGGGGDGRCPHPHPLPLAGEGARQSLAGGRGPLHLARGRRAGNIGFQLLDRNEGVARVLHVVVILGVNL